MRVNIQQTSIDCFFEEGFLRTKKLLVLIYSNENKNPKRKSP